MLAYLTQMVARIGALSPLAAHMVGIDQVRALYTRRLPAAAAPCEHRVLARRWASALVAAVVRCTAAMGAARVVWVFTGCA